MMTSTSNDAFLPMTRSPASLLFGVGIDAVTMDEALDRVDAAIIRGTRLLIGVVNAAKIVNMRRDAELRDSVRSADMILADGMAVVWASRILGAPLPERVTGIDLMMGMFERGEARGYHVYLLGATEEVSAAVAARIARDFPGVRVVGRHHGYFTPEEEPALAAAIAAARPHILLAAMTSPKKERFLARWFGSLGVPVCHGVGGSFDVFAGEVRRAPRLFQRLGLEWLFRVLQEPRRLWRRYLVTNALFVGALLRELRRRPAAA